MNETSFGVEQRENGVYSITTSTRYNAQGEPLTGTQLQLISQLSATLESKNITRVGIPGYLVMNCIDKSGVITYKKEHAESTGSE